MQAIPTTSRGGGAGVEQLGEGKPGNADRYRADRDPEGENSIINNWRMEDVWLDK